MAESSFRSTETVDNLALKAIQETLTPLHIVDETLTIIFCNAAIGTLSRGVVNPEETIGKNLLEAFPFLKAGNIEEEYRRAFAGEKIITEDITDYVGEKIYTETSKIPLPSPSGAINYVMTLIRDITTRKMAVKKLKDYTERLEEIIQERTHEIEIRTQRLEAMNEIQQALEKSLNVEEILNIVIKNVQKLIPCQEVSIFLLTGARDFQLAARKIYKLKDSPIEEKNLILRNETPLTNVIRGKRPILRKNLRQEAKLLEFDHKLLEKGIVSDLSVPLIGSTGSIGVLHIGSTDTISLTPESIPVALELAQPIGITLGNAVLFDKLVRSNQELQFYLDLLATNTQESCHTITNFLQGIDRSLWDEKVKTEIRETKNLLRKVQTLSGIHRQYREMNFDLKEILERTIQQIQSVSTDKLAPKDDIQFYLETPDQPCMVRGDMLIDDLFLNLFSNALKFNEKPQKIVRVSLYRNSEGFSVYIDDEGIGIPDEKKETIFEHGASASTELGLIIVKKLVEKYRGRISVMNRIPGDYTKGTRFIVFFPCPGKERVEVLDYSRLKPS